MEHPEHLMALFYRCNTFSFILTARFVKPDFVNMRTFKIIHCKVIKNSRLQTLQRNIRQKQVFSSLVFSTWRIKLLSPLEVLVVDDVGRLDVTLNGWFRWLIYDTTAGAWYNWWIVRTLWFNVNTCGTFVALNCQHEAHGLWR